MPASKYRPISMRPLTGILDARSNTDEKAPGSFAWKLNAAINADGKLCRAKGWRRHGDIYCPRNADFHDQGVADPENGREPVTVLFSSSSNDGDRRLFGGTKTRLLLLNEVTGDWTHWDGYGADGSDTLTQRRFMLAELQDRVFYTNDFDLPGFIDLAAIGTGPQTSADLPHAGENDAGNPVALTKARVVISWNDVIIYMNTVEGGVRRHNRIRWSDLKDGRSLVFSGTFDTDDSSIANFQDIDYGHVILNALPIGTALYVFTDRSIWRTQYVADTNTGDAKLDAVRVYYDQENQAKCLAYPNSLVSDGDAAWYMGTDGIYTYRPGYTNEPELREWLHRSTSIIFNGTRASNPKLIDPTACNSPVAEYHKTLNEIHFSWPVYDPSAEPVNPGADVNCADYEPPVPPLGSGLNIHTLVANVKYETSDYRNYGSTAMANFRSDIGGGDCNQIAKLLSANSSDLCIKELNYGYAREMFSPTVVEQFTVGYFSLLRGVFPFQNFDSEKEIAKFLVGHIPEDPADTAVLRLRLGTSDAALDPNGANGRCAVLFHQLSNKPIKCHYTRSAAQYLVDNVRPDDQIQWTFFYKGLFLYYELTVAASDNAAPKTGGMTLSRFEVMARAL